jgi:hypothetical protein
MGIFRLFSRLWMLCRPLPSKADSEYMVDQWLREAFLEYKTIEAPTGTWERLRKGILERQMVHGHGMWVLDEPMHDPPETLPAGLSGQEYLRALRMYDSRRERFNYIAQSIMWGNLTPGFSALVNW